MTQHTVTRMLRGKVFFRTELPRGPENKAKPQLRRQDLTCHVPRLRLSVGKPSWRAGRQNAGKESIGIVGGFAQAVTCKEQAYEGQ